MTHRWGERYTGPYCADPKLTREQGERQLLRLGRTPDGRELVTFLFLDCTGGLYGACPQVGQLMVATILDHEYPTLA